MSFYDHSRRSQEQRAYTQSAIIFARTKTAVQEWIDEQRLIGRLVEGIDMQLVKGLLEDRIRVKIRATDNRFRAQTFGLRKLPVTPGIIRFIQDMFPGKTL